MGQDRAVKNILTEPPWQENGRITPMKRWLDQVEVNLRLIGIGSWRREAEHRDVRRTIVLVVGAGLYMNCSGDRRE